MNNVNVSRVYETNDVCMVLLLEPVCCNLGILGIYSLMGLQMNILQK